MSASFRWPQRVPPEGPSSYQALARRDPDPLLGGLPSSGQLGIAARGRRIPEEEDTLKPAVTGALVFMSTPDKEVNNYYLGPASLEETARQIATASGPCGNNRDYLFLLEKAMFNIGHEDDHVIELANEVRKVLANLKEKIPGVHISWKPHKPAVHPLDNSSCLPADMPASMRLSDMV